MKRKFDALDYVIFVLILFISIFIGLYFGFNLDVKLKNLVSKIFRRVKRPNNKVENKDEGQDNVEVIEISAVPQSEAPDEAPKAGNSQTMNYFTANSSMGAFPIALSLLATFFSSSSLLGFPAEVYENGIQYFVVIFGVSLVPIIGALMTGPFFHNLKVVSVFEYLKLRYNSEKARLLGVTLYLIRTFIAMGIVIYGPATALNSLTDIPTEWSIFIIGVIATFYTTIGGIKAVIWTDAFQTIIMFAGMIAAIVKGVYDVGGFGNLFDINREGGRLNLFDFNPDPLIRQSFWPLVIGSFFAWSMSYALDQQMVQRFSAAKSKRTAQTALLLNIPGIILLIGVCCFTGLVLYANYATCDPVKDSVNTGLKNYNQLLPYFVLDKFNNIPCIPGLFLSSIFCASLSSVSSALNSMSACIWRDYLMHLRFFKSYDDKKTSLLNKVIVLVIGIICMSFSFLISQLGANLIQISNTINGALQAPIIGIFVLSSMFPFANIYGLFVGAVSGFSMTSWISIGSFITKPQYPRLPVSVANCTSVVDLLTTSPATSDFFELARSSGHATNLSGFNRIYSLSYQWLSPLGVLTTVIIGCLVSAIANLIINHKNPNREKIRLDDSLILYRFVRSSWSGKKEPEN